MKTKDLSKFKNQKKFVGKKHTEQEPDTSLDNKNKATKTLLQKCPDLKYTKINY